jgi:putative transport protein
LTADNNWKVVFGRLKHNQSIELASGLSILDKEDLVSLIGTPEDVDAAAAQIGEVSGEQLELDRSEYDFRRIFVSNLDVAGRKLSALRLPQTYGAIVTRVRRGDIELLAHSNLVLELGDRVRVVAPRPLLKALSDFFGDSYRALSELNLFSLGLGIGLGIVIGMIPIPLPGGIEFKLGTAGGPLLVALVLGALHRTGRLVWTIPYSANLTIRQLGLTMLLAGIGTRSGYTFLQTLSESGGWSIFLSGALISLSTAFFMLWVGYKWLKIPFGVLTGMTAAVHTQPAVQGFAVNQAGNDLPNHGYALAFPMATIAKIIIAQALMALLK